MHLLFVKRFPPWRLVRALPLVVDSRLTTDPLLPREDGLGGGTGTQARPPLTPNTPQGCLSKVALATGSPPGGDSSPLLARPLRFTALA